MMTNEELKQITNAFSSSSFGDLSRGNLTTAIALKTSLGFSNSQKVEVGKLFEIAFEHLKKNYKSEYIYKCLLYKKVILGTHSPNTTALLPELKLGSSKVDAFVINGIATSYEIKSEFDNLDRVQKQLTDYSEYSDKVFVIGPEDRAHHLKTNIDESFGIKVLTRRGTFSTIRESSIFRPSFTPNKVLSLLTAKELKDIIRCYRIDIDDVPNTQLFKVGEHFLSKLSEEELKKATLGMLKKRGIAKNKLLVSLPYEMSGRASHLKLSKKKQARIIEALSTPI